MARGELHDYEKNGSRHCRIPGCSRFYLDDRKPTGEQGGLESEDQLKKGGVKAKGILGRTRWKPRLFSQVSEKLGAKGPSKERELKKKSGREEERKRPPIPQLGVQRELSKKRILFDRRPRLQGKGRSAGTAFHSSVLRRKKSTVSSRTSQAGRVLSIAGEQNKAIAKKKDLLEVCSRSGKYF